MVQDLLELCSGVCFMLICRQVQKQPSMVNLGGGGGRGGEHVLQRFT